MATIYDIAKKAGVSVGTVSNVINGKPTVSPELRRRVEAAIEAIGYTPNPAARSLARGESSSIGVLYPFNPNYVAGTSYLDFVSQIISYCQELNYQVVLYPSTSPDTALEDLKGIVQSRQVGAYILFEVDMIDHRVGYLVKEGLPFVMVGRTVDTSGLSYVDADIGQIIKDGVSHLSEVGCRRIAHLGRKPLVGVDSRIYTALAKETRERGLILDPSLTLWTSWSPHERLQIVEYFVNRHREFDAILISEAAVRFQFVQEALRAGLRIPDDLMVLGYMETHLDEHAYPSITAFDVQADLMVKTAVEALLDSQESGPRQVLIPGKLNKRDSTRKRNASENQHYA